MTTPTGSGGKKPSKTAPQKPPRIRIGGHPAELGPDDDHEEKATQESTQETAQSSDDAPAEGKSGIPSWDTFDPLTPTPTKGISPMTIYLPEEIAGKIEGLYNYILENGAIDGVRSKADFHRVAAYRWLTPKLAERGKLFKVPTRLPTAPGSTSNKNKIVAHLHPTLAGQIRGFVMAAVQTPDGIDGIKTMSQLFATAAEAYMKHLEVTYHKGNSWKPPRVWTEAKKAAEAAGK